MATAALESDVSVDKTMDLHAIHKAADLENKDSVKVYCYFDKHNKLTNLEIKKCTLPREVLQVMVLLLVYQPQLQSITINAKINKYTMTDIVKIQKVTKLTEVNFDGTFVKEANYYILLNDECMLRSMSLSRCKLNPAAIKMIADRLKYPKPASKTLGTLDLSSNCIGDQGCVYLSEALRTNRCLHYLNLADNQITDFGAEIILNKLLEFPLTPEEVIEKKKRRFEFLKEKTAAAAAAVSAALKAQMTQELKETKTRNQNVDKKKKASITKPEEEFKDVFVDPFDLNSVIVIGDAYYSKGNNVLSYIDFTYNQLGFPSVAKLLKVLEHQRIQTPKEKGLIRLVLHGNPLPRDCIEMIEVDQIFTSFLVTNKKTAKNILKIKKPTVIEARTKGTTQQPFPELTL